MKKLILLAGTFLFVATISAQTTVGRKAGGAQQDYPPPARSTTPKSVERVKKVELKKTPSKTPSGNKASISAQNRRPALANVSDRRRMTEIG